MSIASCLLWLAEVYCMIGALVAVIFLTIGIDRVDEDARGAYVFRPLLIPAVLLIWPLVLWRWYREETGRARWQGRYSPPRAAAHSIAAWALAAAIVAALAIAFTVRQERPMGDDAPVLITPPQGDQG